MWRRWSTTVALSATGVLLLSMTTAGASAAPALKTKSYTHSDGRILTGSTSPYEYAPTAFYSKTNKKYRMLHCGQLPGGVPGDDILYSQSSRLYGPYRNSDGGSPKRVLSGRGGKAFDAKHVCDPSLVWVDGKFYMYYTGAAKDGGINAIGLATSKYVHRGWQRSRTQPVVTSSKEVSRKNKYGAGQPSVTYVNGYFHLMFTDTYGKGSQSNGAGQYLWRSKHATFPRDSRTQVATSSGWRNYTRTNSRSFSVVNAFSADLLYSTQLKSIVIARNNESRYTWLDFLSASNPREDRPKYNRVRVKGSWAEGPGLVTTSGGKSLPDTSGGYSPVRMLSAGKMKSVNGQPHPYYMTGKSIWLKPGAAAASPARIAPSISAPEKHLTTLQRQKRGLGMSK